MLRTAACLFCLASLLIGASGCTSLRPEKKVRRPIRTDYSVQDAEFANSISQLLSAPLVDSNNVVELLNGQQIFPAMLEAIRSAQKTITMEMYIWSSGEVSRQFVAALSERARAGVKVNIIVDAIGSVKLSRADRDELTRAGAKLISYNPPLPLGIFGVNHRTHRKNMVVDGRIGFTGGVCLTDSWMGNAGIMARALKENNPASPGQVVELGAGDGKFFLRVAAKTGWRGVQAREQVIKAAIYGVLQDMAEVERIFLIIKAQAEY